MTSKIQKNVLVSQALLIFVAYLFKRDAFSEQSVMLMRKNVYNGTSMTDVIYSKPCANVLDKLVGHSRGTLHCGFKNIHYR